MRFWISLEGRETEVEFRSEGGRLWLEMDGRRIEADVHPLPDGEVYSLLVDGRSHEVRVTPAGEGLEVTVEGATLAVMVRHPLEKILQGVRRAGATSGVETVAAPMPGLVVTLKVRRGDTVVAGQSVAVIEAMKMQNELAAKHGGTVAEVLVEAGASVAGGQPLVRIKPEDP